METAVGPDGHAYARGSDAAVELGWPDPRKVRRSFPVTEDPEIVEAVLAALGQRPGAPPTWLVRADAVDAHIARQARVPGATRRRIARDIGEQYSAEAPEVDRSSESSAHAPELQLRSDIEELRAARGFAQEHRERLLHRLKESYRLAVELVDDELLLLAEMRQFEVPATPPSERRGE